MTLNIRALMGSGSPAKLYVEDVFSTYLYTGTNANQTITNNIDLSGKGGMVLLQCRSNDTGSAWNVYDTQRGARKFLVSSGSREERTTGAGSGLTSFNSNGFTLGTSWNTENFTNYTYASWTFREAPKFFDVVTYTGNGSNRTIAHSLGAVPGCIIIKRLQDTYDWQVYHRSNANTEYMVLNSTAAKATGTTRWNSTTPTATEFSLGTDATVNASGGTYVAYLFAHDTTSDGIIQCGSFTAVMNTPTEINLGWEPQWIMIKTQNTADTGWIIIDNMRKWANNREGTNGDTDPLEANSSGAEYDTNFGWPTATGFVVNNLGNLNCVYVAIRRGPMKIPTSGTSVFAPVTYSGDSSSKTVTSGFPVDLFISGIRSGSEANTTEIDRIRGGARQLITSSTSAESSSYSGPSFASMTGVSLPNNYINDLGNRIGWMFRRAPSFFDVVAYTGNGVNNRNIPHNLGAVPEMVIYKSRSLATDWNTYVSYIGATNRLQLNTDLWQVTNGYGWNNTDPTATNLILGGSGYGTNNNGAAYVAYLFASCPGVSKVGSYTGNGSSQTINCGFAAGARFVMIKRTDSTGDWYIWDTARGIVSGNDPHLSLNTIAAEVTTDDSIDTNSSGFVVNQLSATNINVSSATYIYLAIA